MIADLRCSGFAYPELIRWGTHLCHLYESRDELLRVTADFLLAGLAKREAGVWAAPAVLGPDKARHMLRRARPALDTYLASGQLHILDGTQVYAAPQTRFNGGATVGLWSRAIDEALGRGFEGLRIAGDAVCDRSTNWPALLEYEASLKERLACRPIVGLCTYCVTHLRGEQARDIERVHDATITERTATRLREPHVPRTAQAAACTAAVPSRATQIAGHLPAAEAGGPPGAVDALNAHTAPVIGHELRNAVTPLTLLARLLTVQYPDDPQLARYALLVSRQTDLLAQLADRLMQSDDIATPCDAAGSPTPVSIDDLLMHCVQVAEANVPDREPIRIEPSGEPLSVRGDFGRLSQVFVNLLVNALKYSPPSGSVDVSVARAGRYCYIAVRDNGIGIAPDDLKTIFKPYARARGGREHTAHGHGIGLSVVRAIVVEHGGSVDAFSAGHGHGAEFLVRLPLACTGAAPSLRYA